MNDCQFGDGKKTIINCEFCDGCGGEKTYANQRILIIDDKPRGIDRCISDIVVALNDARNENIKTMASCCGHQSQLGRIDLADGRILYVWTPKENTHD